MEKIYDVYSKIISKENLYCSAYMASRGRRYRDTTADFNFRLEEEIDSLHNELLMKTYRHGQYRLFTIYDPKERQIAAAPFRDRVVHHAVHDVIEPVIDKTLIYDSYACRKDKGTHKAVNRAQSFLKANRFCLHGDVKKYFYSINHDLLKRLLRMRIEDRDLLWLLDEIIDSSASLRGLPIGNLTSQFFANLYLNELDYFVKFNLRERYYIRYMDDFLIFGNDNDELSEVKTKIGDFLKNNLTLGLHEDKSQIYKTRNGIKFLGFRIYKGYRRLTSDNVRRFKKRLKRFAYLFESNSCHCERSEAISKRDCFTPSGFAMTAGEIRDSVRCWVAHAKYANTGGLRLNISKGLIKESEAIAKLLKPILLDGITVNSERERERVETSFAFSFAELILAF